MYFSSTVEPVRAFENFFPNPKYRRPNFGGPQTGPVSWTEVNSKGDTWDHGPNDRAKLGLRRSSGLGGVSYEKCGGSIE